MSKFHLSPELNVQPFKGVNMSQKLSPFFLLLVIACGKGNSFKTSPLPLINPEIRTQESFSALQSSFTLTAPATLRTSFQNTGGKLWNESYQSASFGEMRKIISSEIFDLFHQQKISEMVKLSGFTPIFTFKQAEILNLKAQIESIVKHDDRLIFPAVEIVLTGVKNISGKKLTVFNQGKFIDLVMTNTSEEKNLVVRTNNLNQFLSLIDENSIIGFKDTRAQDTNFLIWDGNTLERHYTTKSIKEALLELDPDAVIEDKKVIQFKNIYTDEKNGHWEFIQKAGIMALVYHPYVLTSLHFDGHKTFTLETQSQKDKEFDLKSELELDRGDEVTVEISNISFFKPVVQEAKKSLGHNGEYLITREFNGQYEEVSNHTEFKLEDFHLKFNDLENETKRELVIYHYQNGEKTQAINRVITTFTVSKYLNDLRQLGLRIGNKYYQTYVGYEKFYLGAFERAGEFQVQSKAQYNLELKVRRHF